MTNKTDLLAVQPDLFEAELGTVINAQQKFNSKRNKWLQDKINGECQKVTDWFKANWPDHTVKVNVIFADVKDELEIRRTITYKEGHTFSSVISSDIIEPRTWTSPYLMDDYTKNFFQDQTRRIAAVMEAKEKGIIN